MRLALPLLLSLALPAAAQGPCATDAMLVLDGSASMAEIGFDTGAATRIAEARIALARILPEVEPYRRIGLIAYGPGGTSACTGIDLRFPPKDRAAAPIVAAVDALAPAGLTPLSAAVDRAADALSHRTRPGIVVLVTDGNETCGGRPCALGQRLATEATDLTVHVIGFRATRDAFAWDNPEQAEYGADTVAKCLADWTGGLFVDTETGDELVAALRQTLGCPLTG